MTEAEKQAQAIYETFVAHGPPAPHFLPHRGTDACRNHCLKENKNPGFIALARAQPDVLLAYLDQCFGWLRAGAHLAKNYFVCNTISEGIQVALTRVPKPLPTELVLRTCSAVLR